MGRSMSLHVRSSPDVHAVAEAVVGAYAEHAARFRQLTRQAADRFAARDWHGMHGDAAARLDLYPGAVSATLDELHRTFGEAVGHRGLWRGVRQVAERLIAHLPDAELAETFYNSIARRLFPGVGVDPAIEFADHASEPSRGSPVTLRVPGDGDVSSAVAALLAALPLRAPWRDVRDDAQRIARRLLQVCGDTEGEGAIAAIETLPSVFYRSTMAYVVGRVVRHAGPALPFTLVLQHREDGVMADAVLLSEDEVSIVFSFTRSYFHVDLERPCDTIEVLSSIMPRKPLAELYTSLGYNKHGKTRLYRELLRHIGASSDGFQPAQGVPGMVMAVFTLPSFDVVFKVIRDRFDYPKTTTRRDVMQRYQLVFKHDRAGRLVDAQEFEHLAFSRDRFPRELLDDLCARCGDTITVRGDWVEFSHLYTERRLTPLDLFLAQAPRDAARDAVLDYGQAVKDLAATNVFPGDLLLKNFGVTRHGRVVFYDYDELCFLTDCRFRRLPQATHYDDEIGSEPWFHVADNDVFPEEFVKFLALPADLRDTFLEVHGEIFDPSFWERLRARHQAGDVIDILPYKPSRRLRPATE
jgi:isocitrate dehydrogenase kinase/phosphatase